MKKLNTIAMMAMMVIGLTTGLTACGDDDDDDGPVPTKPSVVLQKQSIAEGEEVDAKSTTQLTLSYSVQVKPATTTTITLNGAPVAAQRNPQDVKGIIIPLTLEEGTSYTLTIPEGSVIATVDATATAPAFTLNFKTKAAPEPLTNEATALTKKLGWGWNLGNHFDTSSDKDGTHPQWGYWDNATPTQTLYTNLKKAGASTVRICATWGNYQTADPWTIEPAYLAEVKQNVDWAEQAGLNVILNMHHDEYWQDIKSAASNNILNDQVKDRITKTWTQIAEAFKDRGDFLFFETFNEVQDGQWGWGANRTDGGKQYNTLNEWNQTAVDAIRATGGNNATRW
ncbi:MAG: glycoside hydrolase family 5 protein, partial [Prevotella sp.]|nr:glycoside hydrolase family 5 protein [Prevotella sp.]